MYYSEFGDELKKFNTRDSGGVIFLCLLNIRWGIITSEDKEIVKRRADKLNADYLFMGVTDKLLVVQNLVHDLGIKMDEVAYIGDDLNDLPLMARVGLPVAVPNAAPEIIKASAYCTRKAGGEGAVRELIILVLKARGLYEKAVEKYLREH